MVYVVAETHRKFTHWCREKGLNPFPGAREARYVHDVQQLLGTRGIKLVFIDASWPILKEREAAYYVQCHGGSVEYAYA